MLVNIIICLVVGYICGCFMTGYFVSKIKKVDIRKKGSGNVGTTNSIRVFGKKIGYLIFVGDFMKAFLPVMLMKFVFFKDDPMVSVLCLLTGLGAILGHDFPFFLKFKGGKGVATMVGAICGYDWRYFIVVAIVFFGVFEISRFVSLGSIITSVAIPVFMLIFHWGEWWEFLITVIYCLLTVWSHRSNIKRLISGTENAFPRKKKKEEQAS